MNQPHGLLDESWHRAESLLSTFEEAWQAGSAPRLEDFLPRDAPSRRHLLEELVKIDLEYRWRRPAEIAGPLPARPLLEDYLRCYPELGDQAVLSPELIAEEYRVRRCWGDRPTHDEYRKRFPGGGDQLGEQLRAVDGRFAGELDRKPQLTRDSDATLSEPATLAEAISVSGIVEMVRDLGLLAPSQQRELESDLQKSHPEPMALGRALLQRGWLTPYQINHLLQGRGGELTLGPYLLLERLGEGGTGRVYKALHRYMKRLVALKVLRRELLVDPEVVARFYREIQVVSQLGHPHVIHAYDAGPIGPDHVLVMEYAEGTNLARLVKRSGTLPVETAVDYIAQAARGLQHIHEQGLVHRDIKPSNLLLTQTHGPQPVVKVLDLGLARLGRIESLAGPVKLAEGGSTAQLTPQGAAVVGTPDYLAPEQALDFHQADIRADIYSLGCTLYYLLTGQAPFPGGSLAQKLTRHQYEEPQPLDGLRPDEPPALTAIAEKMLAKAPGHRYQTPEELLRAFAAAGLWKDDAIAEPIPSPAPTARQEPRPPDQRRRQSRSLPRYAAAFLAFGLAGFCFWFVYRLGLNGPHRAESRTDTAPALVLQLLPLRTLHSTGMAANGKPLADGAIDPHWTLLATPAGPTRAPVYATINTYPVGVAWLANSPTSRWISPQANEKAPDPPGSYTYRTSFDLTGFDPATARVSMQVAVDNDLTDVRLNGVSIGLRASGYGAFTPLTISHGFVDGTNTLDFIVLNTTPQPSPSGLRVELTGTAIGVAREPVGLIRNGGFEIPNLGSGNRAFRYAVPDGDWTFDQRSGISGNQSGFTAGNPDAPEGVQVGFLQDQGSLSQSAVLPAGTYVLIFQAAQRGNISHGGQDFEVLVDRMLVGRFQPAQIKYQEYQTNRFTVTAGNHLIRFRALNSRGGDNTVFLDAIRLKKISPAGNSAR